MYPRKMERHCDKCNALEAKNKQLEKQLEIAYALKMLEKVNAEATEKKLEIAVEAISAALSKLEEGKYRSAESELEEALAAIKGEV